MRYKIGFDVDYSEKKSETICPVPREVQPRRSVVQVYFPCRKTSWAYYNDCFDLKVGDFVFVEGKLEGQLGRVKEVNYNFKIKPSDYKRVISVADTEVRGQFHMAESHFVTFDPLAIPMEKIRGWYKPSVEADEEFLFGTDESVFLLNDLKGMQIAPAVAERGHEYYVDSRVVYLCVDGCKGYAIVQGQMPYEVEFDYSNGEIRNLTCTCFCSGNCKHEFAAMLQLKETLDLIGKHYAKEHEHADYFAAIAREVLLDFAVNSRETGSFAL